MLMLFRQLLELQLIYIAVSSYVWPLVPSSTSLENARVGKYSWLANSIICNTGIYCNNHGNSWEFGSITTSTVSPTSWLFVTVRLIVVFFEMTLIFFFFWVFCPDCWFSFSLLFLNVLPSPQQAFCIMKVTHLSNVCALFDSVETTLQTSVEQPTIILTWTC
jgi:hypothetical protein